MKLNKILPPIILGNMFEWYDFSLYGYMATIITKLFFPQVSPNFGLITAFAVFLTGYIVRPIGAMIFGYYADTLGSKTTLSISILLMAVSTSLIGFLPTYNSYGILASIALLACRIIQGFAIGGEFTLSVAYLIESSPPEKKSLYGSFSMLGTFLGLLTGSLSITILNMIFSDVEIISYAWRIPFLLSLLLGIIGLFMRLKLPETVVFTKLKAENKIVNNPTKILITQKYMHILIAVGVVSLGACNFSLWFIWLPSFLKLYSKLSASNILLINSCNLLFITIAIPFVGILADKIGNKSLLAIAAISTLILSIPAVYYMNNLSLYNVWLSQLILAILASLAYGVVPITLFNLFPSNIRCSGTSIAYNIANILFGGCIPVIASIILRISNNLIYQCLPVITSSLLILILLPQIKAN